MHFSMSTVTRNHMVSKRGDEGLRLAGVTHAKQSLSQPVINGRSLKHWQATTCLQTLAPHGLVKFKIVTCVLSE